MVAGIIIFILAVIAGVNLFLMIYSDTEPAIWYSFVSVVLPISLGGGVFMLKDALSEWWYSKFPGRLDSTTKEIMETKFVYFKSLNPDLKKEFENRLINFKIQKTFQTHGLESSRGDIVTLVSATFIQVGFGLKDYILPKLGIFIFYPKQFISPTYPTQLHAVEYATDDYDCIIMSMEAFVLGHVNSSEYYHVGIHAAAKAIQVELKIKDDDIPWQKYKEDKDQFVMMLCTSRGFKTHFQVKLTGIQEPELFPLCVEHFFQRPFILNENFPELYQYLKKTLNQDPMYADSPVAQTAVEAKYEV